MIVTPDRGLSLALAAGLAAVVFTHAMMDTDRPRGVVAVSVPNFTRPPAGSYAARLDEQARRKGVRPIASANELRADVFESDDELDEFLTDLEALRREHVA